MPRMVVTERMREAMREVLANEKALTSEELKLLKRESGGTQGTEYSMEVVELIRRKLQPKPWLHELLAGSSVAPPPPLPPKKPNPENEKRLAKIRAQLEEEEYMEMVKDVRREEIKAGQAGEMKGFKAQLGEGMNVIFGKVTAFAIGYYGSRTLHGVDTLHNNICGLIGLIVGLLVDGLLLVLRTTAMIDREQKKETKDKHKHKRS